MPQVPRVGRTDGPLYATRRKILPLVEEKCRINDWRRSYSHAEMGISQRSQRY